MAIRGWLCIFFFFGGGAAYLQVAASIVPEVHWPVFTKFRYDAGRVGGSPATLRSACAGILSQDVAACSPVRAIQRGQSVPARFLLEWAVEHVESHWAVATVVVASRSAAAIVADAIAPLLRRTAISRQNGFGTAQITILHVQVAHRQDSATIQVVDCIHAKARLSATNTSCGEEGKPIAARLTVPVRLVVLLEFRLVGTIEAVGPLSPQQCAQSETKQVANLWQQPQY